jgi:hypothetical protein
VLIAYKSLSLVDAAAPLGTGDLELLTTAAARTGGAGLCRMGLPSGGRRVAATVPGEYEAGYAAAEIGERFGDVDLIVFALHAQGRALIRLGRVKEGLGPLDEAMVAVIADELSSPLFTGLICCRVMKPARRFTNCPGPVSGPPS